MFKQPGGSVITIISGPNENSPEARISEDHKKKCHAEKSNSTRRQAYGNGFLIGSNKYYMTLFERARELIQL